MSRRTDRLIAPLLRAWGRLADTSNAVPHPEDAPRAHSPGRDLDRVLLFGSGPAMGWGVMSHQIALPGALARALSVRSGRGTDVDVVADPKVTARNAIGRLSAITLTAYDAFVVSLGVNDSLALLPVNTWRRQLVGLVDALRMQAPPRTRIVLLGIPPIRSIATCRPRRAPTSWSPRRVGPSTTSAEAPLHSTRSRPWCSTRPTRCSTWGSPRTSN